MFKTIGKTLDHIDSVQLMMLKVMRELSDRLRLHDRSKFNEDELTGYARFESMPEGLEYGSEEYKAEMAKVMKDNDCFKLHCERNDHHPEHYEHPTDMPLCAVIEMVCDWAGATISYGNKGTFMDGVENNLGRWDFSEGQRWVIYEVAELLVSLDSRLEEE